MPFPWAQIDDDTRAKVRQVMESCKAQLRTIDWIYSKHNLGRPILGEIVQVKRPRDNLIRMDIAASNEGVDDVDDGQLWASASRCCPGQALELTQCEYDAISIHSAYMIGIRLASEYSHMALFHKLTEDALTQVYETNEWPQNATRVQKMAIYKALEIRRMAATYGLKLKPV